MPLLEASCNCFGQDAEACVKSFMDGCAQLIPPLKDCLIAIFKGEQRRPDPNQISSEVQPNPEQIPVPQMEHNHMILAEHLKIPGSTDKHWKLNEDPKDTRFKKAWWLEQGSQSFEIKATIDFDLLLHMKTYVVYLIFKTSPDSGFNAVLSATVSVGIIKKSKDVCLTKDPKVHADQKIDDIKLPVESSYDEWMELELGKFLCNKMVDMAEITIKVKGTSKHTMRAGVYVAGIELRSKP